MTTSPGLSYAYNNYIVISFASFDCVHFWRYFLALLFNKYLLVCCNIALAMTYTAASFASPLVDENLNYGASGAYYGNSGSGADQKEASHAHLRLYTNNNYIVISYFNSCSKFMNSYVWWYMRFFDVLVLCCCDVLLLWYIDVVFSFCGILIVNRFEIRINPFWTYNLYNGKHEILYPMSRRKFKTSSESCDEENETLNSVFSIGATW